MDALSLGCVSESNNQKLIENFIKRRQQMMNKTVCAGLASVSVEEDTAEGCQGLTR